MAKGILMPKTGITVEECILTEWIKKKGDYVKIGDILFSYETDKSTFECESTEEGTLLELFYEEGDEVPVLVNVCAIGTKGEEVEYLRNQSVQSGEGEAEHSKTSEEKTVPLVEQTEKMENTENQREQMLISPRARRVAKLLDVDPSLTVPTGAHGRIIERDIHTYLNSRPGDGFGGKLCQTDGDVKVNNSAVVEEAREQEYIDVKFSSIRRATARAMTTSLSTMAQLTHFHSFDATAIMNLRKQIKAQKETMGLPDITLNDMILYAVSRVLMKHGELNAVMPEENILRKYTNVHLGMAVHTERGLFVPTIFDANKKTLAELSSEAKTLAEICREGKATPEMLSGASFTISNVGALGVEMFTPVVNPPQVGILGVCSVITRVRDVNGQMQMYPAMGLALSYDHRALDGTPAALFVKELCTALEHFDLLMMK